jgi:flagellar biosynthesis/type III secretory pathway protein FliH
MEKRMRSHYEFRSELALERYAQGRMEGREEGRAEGRKEGEGEGRRAFAAEMLRLRFGAAADPMLPLLAEADGETLRWLAQRLLDPISPEALLEGLVACVRGTPAR